jgi:hypothetical protein
LRHVAGPASTVVRLEFLLALASCERKTRSCSVDTRLVDNGAGVALGRRDRCAYVSPNYY